jgi:hypothetical protein
MNTMNHVAHFLDVCPDDVTAEGNIAPCPPLETVIDEARPLPLPDLESVPEPRLPVLQQEQVQDLTQVSISKVSGGIYKPFVYRRTNWMLAYSGVSRLRIQDCILPGTHNSGSDKEAPRSPSSETCQDVSPFKQLQAGIRVLDLRVQFYSGYASGDSRRFQIFHSSNSGRTVQGDVLRALQQFRALSDADTTREIVILDFHQFKGFSDVAHKELAALIKRELGEKAIVAPSMANKTVGEIWRSGPANTVIAYNNGSRDPLFWGGVNQRWIGSNTPTNNQLKAFLDKVGAEKKGEFELKSVQCAKYALPFFVPNDRSGDIMKWFPLGNNSLIMKHHIINTDWSLRQQLVDNCIYSNWLRAETKKY